MSKRTAGLRFDKKSGFWKIDKKVKGKRIFERTSFGKSEWELAEDRLNQLIMEVSKNSGSGRTFRDAAIKYCVDHQNNRRIKNDELILNKIDAYLGEMELFSIHQDCAEIQTMVSDLKAKNRKNKTINAYLEIIRRILNSAAYKWRDNNNKPWLDNAPKFELLPLTDARPPRPISWDEQAKLLKVLPDHLAIMVLTMINVGARERELCFLQWDWEIVVPKGLAFIIPDHIVKGGTVGERLLVCNEIASSAINAMRGIHSKFVFTYKGKQMVRMNNTAWDRARKLAGIDDLHVHDLRHTFGYRLRQAGIDAQTRRELLGHVSGDITEHYSMADIDQLYKAANAITKPIYAESVVTLKRRKLALVG